MGDLSTLCSTMQTPVLPRLLAAIIFSTFCPSSPVSGPFGALSSLLWGEATASPSIQGVLGHELEEEKACPFPAAVLGGCLTSERRKVSGTSSQLDGDFL